MKIVNINMMRTRLARMKNRCDNMDALLVKFQIANETIDDLTTVQKNNAFQRFNTLDLDMEESIAEYREVRDAQQEVVESEE